MRANVEVLKLLFAKGEVQVNDSPFFASAPPPLPPDLDFDRVEGMMLGLAIGDALGTEGAYDLRRRRRDGFVIRDYFYGRGYPSDDSQMAFLTLEQMLRDGEFKPERVSNCFAAGRITGIGMTVAQFIETRRSGLPWEKCGPRSAGNGALMRIAPILIPHLRNPEGLWADAALCALITHNDSAAIASAVAFVALLWELLRRERTPEPEWWVDSMIPVMRELECDASYQTNCPRIVPRYRGPLYEFLNQELRTAHISGVPTADACDRWFSTAYLFETLPCVLYILMRHGGDPEEAILRAVNDTWDNDTVGAIVGAAVGALHGRRALPSRWIENLSGRVTMAGEDGRMFQLLDDARRVWFAD